jgi:hypothetical protein
MLMITLLTIQFGLSVSYAVVWATRWFAHRVR